MKRNQKRHAYWLALFCYALSGVLGPWDSVHANEADSIKHRLQQVERTRGADRLEQAQALVSDLGFEAGTDYITERMGVDTSYTLAIARYAVADYLYGEDDLVGSSILCLSAVPALYDGGDSLRAFDGLMLQSNNYIRLGAFNDALPVILKAHALGVTLRDSTMIGVALSNLGSLYLSMHKASAAITYLSEAVHITRSSSQPNDHSALAHRLSNLAEAYTVAGEGEKAAEAAREALDYDLAEGRTANIPSRFCVLGDAYVVLGQLSRAERCYLEALARNLEGGSIVVRAIIYKQLGGLRFRQGRTDEANEYLRQALDIANECNLTFIRERTLDLLHKTNRADHPLLALDYFEQFNRLKDSIQEEETQRQLNVLYARYDTQLKEQQIALQQLELNAATQTMHVLLGGIVSAIVLLELLGYLLWKNHMKNRKLKELNETKNRFFSIISHDTKSIATSIKLVLDQTMEYYDALPAEQLKETIQELKVASDSQLELLENLLKWANIQLHTEQFQPVRFDLVPLLERNFELIQLACHRKELRLEKTLPPEAYVYADRNMIDTIARNLLSNAIKFSHPGGVIAVRIEILARGVTLEVRDYGIGMSSEQVANLGRIDRRVQRLGTRGEAGSGLGLILCHSMARRNGAKLRVDSRPDAGTRISLMLPCTAHAKGYHVTQKEA